jgi:ferredoxin
LTLPALYPIRFRAFGRQGHGYIILIRRWKMAVIVDQEKCTGCGTCEEGCPVEAIKVENEKAVVDAETCVDCGTCIEECPEKAISEGA